MNRSCDPEILLLQTQSKLNKLWNSDVDSNKIIYIFLDMVIRKSDELKNKVTKQN